MKKSSLLILLLIITSSFVYSQDYSSDKSIKKINKTYTKKLDLTSKQSKEFKEILVKYNSQLIAIENDKNQFNKVLKTQKIAISKILTVDQYTHYKKIVVELEPYKNYKF